MDYQETELRSIHFIHVFIGIEFPNNTPKSFKDVYFMNCKLFVTYLQSSTFINIIVKSTITVVKLTFFLR